MPQKSDIRREMRARRRALTTEDQARVSWAICEKLIATEAAATASGAAGGDGAVAVYLASPDEIDLTHFIREMLNRGVTVVSPRWNGGEYELARIESLSEEDLRRGPMNILEPAVARIVEPRHVAVWIIPGLAFTADGKRLGYGGGWYDRLLAASCKKSLKIGVAHDFQILEDLPSEPHDIRLDRIVTDA